MISKLVSEKLPYYENQGTSLRAELNRIVIDGVAEGIDMAIADGYRLNNKTRLGKVLDIPALYNQSRPILPKNDRQIDYMIEVLKLVGPRQEFPDEVNNVIRQSLENKKFSANPA